MDGYKQYECIKEFSVRKYDDDGFPEDDYIDVDKGTVWELDEDGGSITGGDIRLYNVDESWTWLEISEQTLEEYFEEL